MINGNGTAKLYQAIKDAKKHIINKQKKTFCHNVFFIYFAYLFTTCNTRIAGNKRLDVLIYENNILWEVALPKYTVHYSILTFFENFAINV